MPDLSQLRNVKRKSRLPEPPKGNDASTTLKAPEHAPAPEASKIKPGNTKKARAKTGRTEPFATRVSKKFDDEFRQLAFDNKLKHAELLEVMLVLYKKHKR